MSDTAFKISFDYDGTLSEQSMQELAAKYLELGAEVYVTTSRPDKLENVVVLNTDLFEVTDKLGIKRENIIFTCYDDKFLHVMNFHIHYDDSEEEIFLINEYPIGICLGFLYEHNYKRDKGITNF